MRQILIEDLKPIFVDFGYLNCQGVFWGKTDTYSAAPRIEIDTASISNQGGARNTIAHELGHTLGLDEDYSTTSNLMYSGHGSGTALTPAQCGLARDHALRLGDRFRTYNETVGRVPPHNTVTPTYPAGQDPAPYMLSLSCCTFGASAPGWSSAAACLGFGGQIVPNSECSECCLFAQTPTNVDWTRVGACAGMGGQVTDHYNCNQECCRMSDYSYQYLPYKECIDNGVLIVDDWYCEL